jgi:sugar lactone lactonase YvrE
VPDGIDVAADGRIFVATVTGGGVDVLAPDGELVDHIPLGDDTITTNCCLDGNVLWVTDFGQGWRDIGSGKGRLWRVETDAQSRPHPVGGIARR